MCFVVQDFSRDAPIRSPQQQTCEGDPLTGRKQPDIVQQAANVIGRWGASARLGRGDTHLHEDGNPRIGTPKI
jgi:hypothetical protein